MTAQSYVARDCASNAFPKMGARVTLSKTALANRPLPLGALMTQKIAPPREVGLLGASLINLNGMVGAGVFALPALLYAGLGNFAPVAILLFAIPTACLALAVCKLSTVFDQSGGAQLYIETALGKFAGFQVGWLVICGSATGRAANFIVLLSYLAALFPVFGGPIAQPLTMLALIAGMTLLCVVGTKVSVGGLWVGTVFKLTPLVLLCLVGLATNGVPTNVSFPDFSGTQSAALLLAYAFSGFATSAGSAGETKDPRTTIYRSVIIGLVSVALFYAFVQWAYIAIGPSPTQSDAPLADAAQKLFGSWGVAMISVAAIFSVAANQLTGFITYPRVLYAMGDRGLLPRFFAHVSPRFLTPDYAIVIYGIVVAAIALSGSFALLAVLLVAVEQIVFVLALISLGVLWKKNFRGLRQSTGPVWLIIVPVAAGMTAWLSMQVPANAVVSTGAMLGIGTALYFIAKKAVAQLPS